MCLTSGYTLQKQQPNNNNTNQLFSNAQWYFINNPYLAYKLNTPKQKKYEKIINGHICLSIVL